MPTPRKKLISLDITPLYHITSRCVRRAYLCGVDPLTGFNYDHRRKWIEDRIMLLSSSFAIDICSYAVMSNHTHLALRINKEKAEQWSDHEVTERWLIAYPGNKLCKAALSGKKLSPTQKAKLAESIEVWRERLYSISWFMRNLNHYIACAANQEDGCTGHFWESRFKSQALLVNKALLLCMVYVDLNPIRAGITNKPETSNYTSVKKRIECLKHPGPPYQPEELFPFVGENSTQDGLKFKLEDYLMLVDLTGRSMRKSNQGFIPFDLPPILERLGFDMKQWEKLMSEFESLFGYIIGPPEHHQAAAEQMGYQRVRGLHVSKSLLSP